MLWWSALIRSLAGDGGDMRSGVISGCDVTTGKYLTCLKFT